MLPAFDALCEQGATFNPAIASMHSAVLPLAPGQEKVRVLDQLVDARVWRLGEGPRFSGWVLVLRDITDLKRAQEERVRRLS